LICWLQEQSGGEIPPGKVTLFYVKRYRDELEDARKNTARKRLDNPEELGYNESSLFILGSMSLWLEGGGDIWDG
jgi:hypothetical protein